MKYSDFLHESEVKHNTISYNLLTPKPLKGKSLKPEKIKVDAAKALSLLAPYTYIRVCLLYTSPSPRDKSSSRMPSSA